MTNEQAKSELMQLYGSLSEEKKKALDVLMAQAEKTCDIEKSNFDVRQYKLDTDTAYECGYNAGLQAQADGEYIDRKVLDECKELMTDINGETVYAVRMEDIRQLPSVDIPNKTGRWIDQDEGAKHSRECNQCGKEPLLDEYGDYVFSKYCPNCGKKMDCTTLD